MAQTLLHPAPDPGELTVLRAEVDELKTAVAEINALIAAAHVEEGQPVPPQFRPRRHLRLLVSR